MSTSAAIVVGALGFDGSSFVLDEVGEFDKFVAFPVGSDARQVNSSLGKIFGKVDIGESKREPGKRLFGPDIDGAIIVVMQESLLKDLSRFGRRVGATVINGTDYESLDVSKVSKDQIEHWVHTGEIKEDDHVEDEEDDESFLDDWENDSDEDDEAVDDIPVANIPSPDAARKPNSYRPPKIKQQSIDVPKAKVVESVQHDKAVTSSDNDDWDDSPSDHEVERISSNDDLDFGVMPGSSLRTHDELSSRRVDSDDDDVEQSFDEPMEDQRSGSHRVDNLDFGDTPSSRDSNDEDENMNDDEDEVHDVVDSKIEEQIQRRPRPKIKPNSQREEHATEEVRDRRRSRGNDLVDDEPRRERERPSRRRDDDDFGHLDDLPQGGGIKKSSGSIASSSDPVQERRRRSASRDDSNRHSFGSDDLEDSSHSGRRRRNDDDDIDEGFGASEYSLPGNERAELSRNLENKSEDRRREVKRSEKTGNSMWDDDPEEFANRHRNFLNENEDVDDSKSHNHYSREESMSYLRDTSEEMRQEREAQDSDGVRYIRESFQAQGFNREVAEQQADARRQREQEGGELSRASYLSNRPAISGSKMIYFTAGAGGIGKTTVTWTAAHQLGEQLYQMGSERPVYLIETDYANPKLEERLGIRTQGTHLGSIGQEMMEYSGQNLVNLDAATLEKIVDKYTLTGEGTNLKILVCPYNLSVDKSWVVQAILASIEIARQRGAYIFCDSSNGTSRDMDSESWRIAKKADLVVTIATPSHMRDTQRTVHVLTKGTSIIRGGRREEGINKNRIRFFLNFATVDDQIRLEEEFGIPFDGIFPDLDEISAASGSWIGSDSLPYYVKEILYDRIPDFLMRLGIPEAARFANRAQRYTERPSLLQRLFGRR